ncbi:hypothetical protein SB2_11760 [Methylobacterium radiotolerans]|nr:hypothetical protein SB3_10955 [Methylobacterium radiotolerans]KTS47969.1 hypothetical protein SB2_11760 [Methylobacterium radiotolerans]
MGIDVYDAQQALGFVRPQFYNIEQTIYEVKYPSFDYASLVPVITEGNEWARGTLFRSMDSAGKAEFLNGKGFDVPYADVTMSQFVKGFELAGIGYEWNLEEVSVAALEQRNLGDDRARAARRIAEQFLWNVCMTGKGDGATAEKGWTGVVNDPNVPAANAPAGTGGGTTFASKKSLEVIADLNRGITGITVTTIETEEADTVLLPTSRHQYLASTAMDAANGGNITILDFFLKNNAYTSRTGRPLTVRALRSLETAGAGGTARMVTYRRSPEVMRFHLPMPHKFLPPFQKGSMAWEVAGIMRTGGTEVRLPSAMSYLDAI